MKIVNSMASFLRQQVEGRIGVGNKYIEFDFYVFSHATMSVNNGQHARAVGQKSLHCPFSESDI